MCTAIPDHLATAYSKAMQDATNADGSVSFVARMRASFAIEDQAAAYWREQGVSLDEARRIEKERMAEIDAYMFENYPHMPRNWNSPAYVSLWNDAEKKILAKREKEAEDLAKIAEANAEIDALVAEVEEMVAEEIPKTERTNKIEGVNEEQPRHRERQKVPA